MKVNVTKYSGPESKVSYTSVLVSMGFFNVT